MIEHSFIDKKENKLEEEMKLNPSVQEQKIEKALLDGELNDAKSVQADESFVDKLMGDNVEEELKAGDQKRLEEGGIQNNNIMIEELPNVKVVLPAFQWKDLDLMVQNLLPVPAFKTDTEMLFSKRDQFSEKFNERYSEEERQKERMTIGTELFEKNENANRLLSIDKNRRERLTAKILEMGGEDTEINEEEAYSAAAFAGNGAELSMLLEKLHSDSAEIRREGISFIIKKLFSSNFIEKDLLSDESVFRDSFATDEAILNNASQFAGLSEMTRALEYLKFRYKEDFDAVPENIKTKFEERRIAMQKIGIYYELKKAVFTDDYYRDHTNKELSLAASKDATKQQRRLVFKMVAADSFAATSKFVKLRDYKEVKYKSVAGNGNDDYDEDVKKLNYGASAEFNKNGIPVAGTVHEDYFNQLKTNHEYARKLQILAGGPFRVSGAKEQDKEFLFRSIGIMANLREIQQMDLEDVQLLVDNLTARPENDSPEAVEDARNLNIEGLRTLKDIAYRHMKYVRDKYGNNSVFMEPEEVEKHAKTRQADFVWLNDLTNGLIPYLDTLGLIDHKSDRDTELLRLSESLSSEFGVLCKSIEFSGNYVEDGPVNMEAFIAGQSTCVVDIGLNDYAFKHQNFMYQIVDGITNNKDDLSVHYEADIRAAKSKEQKTTISRLTQLRNRKEQRSAEKAEIKKLMKSRWSFFGIAPSDSSEMKAVKDGYAGLEKLLSNVPGDGEFTRERQRGRIEEAYRTLLLACDNYISVKNPKTADGKERLNQVKNLRMIMEREQAELSDLLERVNYNEYSSFEEMLDENIPEENVSRVDKEKHAVSLLAVTDADRMWELLGSVPEATYHFTLKKQDLLRRNIKAESEERLSPEERIKAASDTGSEIYKKQQQGFELQSLEIDMSMLLKNRMVEAVKRTEGLPEFREDVLMALSTFMDSDVQKNAKLLSLYKEEDKTGALQLSLWQFMNTTIPNADLSTEEGLLASAERLSLVSLRTAAITKMQSLHPEFFENMPADIKTRFESKLNEMSEVSKYYNLRVMILTNPYYRSHLNDEISLNSYGGDSRELERFKDLLRLEKRYLDGGEISNDYMPALQAGNEMVPAVRYVRHQETAIRRMKQRGAAGKLMLDKWSLFGISPSDSPEMTAIKEGYNGIDAALKDWLPMHAEARDAFFKTLKFRYETLIGNCDHYIKEKNPFTETGKMRKRMVESLRDSLQKDFGLIRAGYESLDKKQSINTFEDLLMKRQPVIIKVDKLPDNIGNGTSIVYKLNENGKVSYFKPAEKKIDRTNPVDIMEKLVVPEDDLQKELLPKVMEAVRFMHSFKVPSIMSEGDALFESLVMGIMKVDRWAQGDPEEAADPVQYIQRCRDVIVFADNVPDGYPIVKVDGEYQLKPIFDIFYSMAKNKDGSFDIEKVNAVTKIYRQACQTFNAGRQMTGMLSLKGDEDLILRNVASSRVADLFGVNDTVAKSESACIVLPDGSQIYGNQMEEAKGVSLAELKVLAQRGNIVFTKEAADQRYALFILDEICDQIDRGNPSNTICEVTKSIVKDKKGNDIEQYKVTKIKGIDNDLAFSFRDGGTVGVLIKQKLGALQYKLPRAQTLRFIETETNVLTASLRDILEQQAIDNLVIRFDKVKAALRELMQERPEIFTDEADQNELIPFNKILS